MQHRQEMNFLGPMLSTQLISSFSRKEELVICSVWSASRLGFFTGFGSSEKINLISFFFLCSNLWHCRRCCIVAVQTPDVIFLLSFLTYFAYQWKWLMALVFIVLSDCLRRTRQLGLLNNCFKLSAGMDREHYMRSVCFIFWRLSSMMRARVLKLIGS